MDDKTFQRFMDSTVDSLAGLSQDVGGLRQEVGGLGREVGGLRSELHEFRGQLNAKLDGITHLLLACEAVVSRVDDDLRALRKR